MSRLFILKSTHSLIFFAQSASLFYLAFSAITATYNWVVLLALSSIVANGLALLLNNGRCPLTNIAENLGDTKGSVTDIFLPRCIADNIFRVGFPVFIMELAVLTLRYFTGS